MREPLHPTPWTVQRNAVGTHIWDANGDIVVVGVRSEIAKRIAQAVNLAAVVEAAVDVYREVGR